MQQTFINLDHNATTPPFRQVVDLVGVVMAEAGNPSSIHASGRRAHQRLETARRQVAALCGARARDLIFCSSATEANNQILKHFAGVKIFRPPTEHQAVLAPCPGIDLGLDGAGALDLEHVARVLYHEKDPLVLAIMAANNETGVISDLKDLAQIVAQARAAGCQVHYHIDAVQAAGKLPIDMTDWGCDSLALSAHKMGGPQGVGALVLRPGLDIGPLIYGGGQERRRRGGTENVAGIAGFGLACELAQDLFDASDLRLRLERGVKALNPGAHIVGEHMARLSNTTCLLTPGKSAQMLLMQFDLAGIGLSSGSACSSGKISGSHVLQAMGYGNEMARSALRFSLGRETTQAHIDQALKAYGAACR